MDKKLNNINATRSPFQNTEGEKWLNAKIKELEQKINALQEEIKKLKGN
jgi:uncharacterized small protein (DUF1192 family)